MRTLQATLRESVLRKSDTRKIIRSIPLKIEPDTPGPQGNFALIKQTLSFTSEDLDNIQVSHHASVLPHRWDDTRNWKSSDPRWKVWHPSLRSMLTSDSTISFLPWFVGEVRNELRKKFQVESTPSPHNPTTIKLEATEMGRGGSLSLCIKDPGWGILHPSRSPQLIISSAVNHKAPDPLRKYANSALEPLRDQTIPESLLEKILIFLDEVEKILKKNS